MQAIHTLHDFFLRSGARVHLYHLGRRVVPCSLETLAAFETGEQPWPYPWQGQARLACVFTLGSVSDPLTWFLALPLDEQGRLIPAPRDAFIQRLLETLGRSVESPEQETTHTDNLMKDNPLTFTPTLSYQAMLHARASLAFDQPASQHLELVEAYLTGAQNIDQWPALGLQGLADFAVRHDSEQATLLAQRLPQLPVEVLRSLCYCLEHVIIGDRLARSLHERGERAALDGDLETLCACVRAVGAGPDVEVGIWFDELLDDPHACGPDLLAAMAARGWEHLEDNRRLPLFLQRVAEHPQADFSALARDLALIPRLRLPLLMCLREAPADSAIGRRLAPLHRQ
ncbi:hypothetical protein L861_12250 [Litchfieldella anticariensis FP35 = DSM 16096]|uniref:DUF3549 domain-containing protein n=1 Tax=Litchfieldella anticariensis (strain DSM 16096 / CECT 5854 / CIP 108499 / LMG 22089 / FP35) TaxID=1121939 RepID=S2L124_LITA3|nr:DUF3549 family protein [Halomonas anticariensis]EPC01339.1 hypothetical protein L861_12250 [Halomonas anticariensis FP35 = DSM 16096]